ncbi:MAG: hypothetical protein KIS61_00730 [Candidatus Eremiobacteraeota bacterium]|nr:hypothetical protein [Candidatus Eremiobacteraeota bacterium]
MNRLLTLYHQLDRDALECLELTWRFQGQVMSVSEFHLNRLLQMELLQFRYSQGWQLNWWGLAVLNWHRQLREAKNRKTLPAKPRGGENGFHLGPPCEKFRVLLFSGVYCWCGRLRSDHLDQASETAAQLLRYSQRNQKLAHPRSRVSGRSFRELIRELPADLCELLEVLSPQGATMHQLHQLMGGRLRFLAIQESLNLLLDLDLVFILNDDLIWHPSWDGLGVKNWLHERTLRSSLDKPMPELQPGENGETALPSPCARYRPLLHKISKPCWCGHLRQAHSLFSIP